MTQVDIPIMAGNTKDDGGFFAAMIWKTSEGFDANLTALAGRMMFGSPKATDMTKLQLIKRFYIGGYQKFSRRTKQATFDFFSDMFFYFPIYRSLQLHARSLLCNLNWHKVAN